MIIKKINRSVTDSGNEIVYDEKNKPGISNLFNIYKSVTGDSIKKIENKYIGKMYSSFKNDLSDILIDLLKPINDEYIKLINDKSYLLNVLKDGSEYAKSKSYKTISKVYRKVGLVNKI